MRGGRWCLGRGSGAWRAATGRGQPPRAWRGRAGSRRCCRGVGGVGVEGVGGPSGSRARRLPSSAPSPTRTASSPRPSHSLPSASLQPPATQRPKQEQARLAAGAGQGWGPGLGA
eukprot:3584075-Rhodomonas_salina.2